MPPATTKTTNQQNPITYACRLLAEKRKVTTAAAAEELARALDCLQAIDPKLCEYATEQLHKLAQFVEDAKKPERQKDF